MTLIIHRNPEPDRLIAIGQGAKVIEKSIPDEKPSELSTIKGRKKMADEKKIEEVGTKKIREDDASEGGAIGSHGENAPAQEKVPEGKEGEDNG